MHIGNLRKRMVLRKPRLDDDGAGGQQKVMDVVDVVWAMMKPVSAVKLVLGAGYERRVTHEIVVRYRADIMTGWTLMLDSRVFQIRAVVNADEANQWLTLMVEEGDGV